MEFGGLVVGGVSDWWAWIEGGGGGGVLYCAVLPP